MKSHPRGGDRYAKNSFFCPSFASATPMDFPWAMFDFSEQISSVGYGYPIHIHKFFGLHNPQGFEEATRQDGKQKVGFMN